MTKIYKPNLAQVKKNLIGSGFKPETVRRSTQKNKKISAVYKDGKRYTAGDSRYSDFTLHKNKERQKRYCKRAGAIKNQTPRNILAMKGLWDCK